MRRARLIVALAVALGLGAGLSLAACGDSAPEQVIDLQQTETQASEGLSKSDFIDEADGICEEANAAIETYVESGEGFTAAGEIADIRQGVVDDIKQLGPPQDDRATLDRALQALQDQVDAGKKIALAIEREEDTSQFESELAEAQAQTQEAAEEYGFRECGSEITASADAGTGGDTGVAPVAPAPVEPAPAPAPAPDSGGTGGDSGGGGGGDSGGTGGGVGIP